MPFHLWFPARYIKHVGSIACKDISEAEAMAAPRSRIKYFSLRLEIQSKGARTVFMA